MLVESQEDDRRSGGGVGHLHGRPNPVVGPLFGEKRSLLAIDPYFFPLGKDGERDD
jgi:hypothetical protein